MAIDPSRGLNNGHPSFLASLIDQLEVKPSNRVIHVGCGTGYYTAIMAEIVGRDGHVTAIEVDAQLAGRARDNLSYFPNVEVIAGDGGALDVGPADAILMNAGATHPRATWLDSLQIGGRLILPLTFTDDAACGGEGRVLKVMRQSGGLAANFISGVGIFSCVGGRDDGLNERLKAAFNQGGWKSVHSLRRDLHKSDDSCWLHNHDFCFSKNVVAPSM